MNTSFNIALCPTGPSRFSNRPAARRGSALLLAVVIVVLMTMMGAAYLQVARTDRRTSLDVDTRANVDNSSILRYIAQILAEDVPITPGATTPEPYDFAWTNSDAAATNEEFVVFDRFAPTTVPGPQPDYNSNNNNQFARPPRATGNLADADGGELFAHSGGGDDLWLASNEPAMTSATDGTWPHLTNLMGVYLDLRGDGLGPLADPGLLPPDANDAIYPRQYLSVVPGGPGTPTGPELEAASDTGVSVAFMATDLANSASYPNRGSRFADADGDGLADSRWTWAPLPSNAGLAYVMAVRIIDNSAMVDLNAWTDPFPAGGATTPEESPRWMWPGELDLESSLASVRTAAGTGGLDANTVMTNADARNMAGTSGSNRYENWLTTTSTRGVAAPDLDPFKKIGSFLERDFATPTTNGVEEFFNPASPEGKQLFVRTEEIELRWKNGLNRTDDNATVNGETPLEERDNPLFRSNDLETDASDSPFTSTRAFFENEPRKQLTTISGSSNAGRLNLNAADLDDIAAIFRGPLDYNGGTPLAPRLFEQSGWSAYFTGGTAEERFNDARGALGNQMAAVVADFRDDDSNFTLVGNAYGMERVPVISEIYAQGRYTASNLTAVAGPPATETVDWTYADHSVVIELVNPWAVPTIVTGIELVVGGESWGDLETLLGADVMVGHEIAVIRRPDADAGAPGPGQTAIAGVDNDNQKATSAPDDYPVAGALPLLTTALDDGVQLIAEDNDGNPVPYQSLQLIQLPAAKIGVSYAPGAVGNGDTAFVFTRRVGTANGLNALAARSIDFEDFAPNVPDAAATPEPNPFYPAADAPTTQFGTASKNVTSTATGISGALSDLDNRIADVQDLDIAAASADEPWLIGDTGRLTRTGDILQMVFMGPRPTTGDVDGIADAWIGATIEAGNTSAALNLKDLMIDLSEAGATRLLDTDTRAPDSYNFATAWMHRFAVDPITRTPLIPGRLNLNTAAERTIAAALPLNNGGTRTALAARIVAARNDPSSLGATTVRNGRVGLAAIGELAADAGNLLDPATNNANLTDFNEGELAPLTATYLGAGLDPDAPGADGYSNDREEQNRLISYLHQVASTRSDIYTAYVLVRAYPVNDFSVPPVDEYRLLAVFDRSTVTGDNPMARILAVVKLDDN